MITQVRIEHVILYRRFGTNIRSFVVTVKPFLFISRITDRALFSCKRLTALPSADGLHKE
jgi:hypothetical protein